MGRSIEHRGDENEEAKKKNACKEILRTYDFYSFFFMMSLELPVS